MIEVSEQVYQEHVNRVLSDEAQMFHDHNPVCPFCGSEGSLRAEVESYYVGRYGEYDEYGEEVVLDDLIGYCNLALDEVCAENCVEC